MFLPTPKPSLGIFSTASAPTSLWQKCSGPQLVVPTEPGKAPGTDRVDQLNHISLSGELKLRVAVFLKSSRFTGRFVMREKVKSSWNVEIYIDSPHWVADCVEGSL